MLVVFSAGLFSVRYRWSLCCSHNDDPLSDSHFITWDPPQGSGGVRSRGRASRARRWRLHGLYRWIFTVNTLFHVYIYFTGFKYTCTSNSEGYIAESHMELIWNMIFFHVWFLHNNVSIFFITIYAECKRQK